MTLRIRHEGGGMLALYRGNERVREIGVTPGWDFRDRDEVIDRYNREDDTRAALTAARTGDSEDAARYRWLRDNMTVGGFGTPDLSFRLNCDEPASEWDAAIDAARKENES